MIKPDQTDFYNVEDFNSNVDIIDAELKRISDAIGSGEAGDNILVRLNNLETKVGNLNNLETTQKTNLVAAINEVRQSVITHINDASKHMRAGDVAKIDGAWQKGVYNDADITNLSSTTVEKVWPFWYEWQDVASVETLVIQIPTEHFWGSIELVLTSVYSQSNAGGGAHVIYHLGAADGTQYVNEKTIVSISSAFAYQFHVGDAVRETSPNRFYIPITKRATGKNPLNVRLKINSTQGGAYNIVNNVVLQKTGQIIANIPIQKSRADEVYDLLFTSVSNGKAQVANAITGKGVPTATNAEFATMAANISAIQTFKYREQNFTRSVGSALRHEVEFLFDAGFPIKNAVIFCPIIFFNNSTANSGVTLGFMPNSSSYTRAGGSTSNGFVLCDVSPYFHSNPNFGTVIDGNYLRIRLTFYSNTDISAQTLSILVQAWGVM